jgi:hypothetical protein
MTPKKQPISPFISNPFLPLNNPFLLSKQPISPLMHL